MKHTISNGVFSLTADTNGAELASVKSLSDGYEYIWQKCDIWQGQSPILFPVVGRLKDDALRVNSGVYTLNKHGFARKSGFVFDGDETALSFTLTENEDTLKSYPYRFSLNVRFELKDDGFVVSHTVKNTDEVQLPFSLGAHPAFRIAIGDRVIMDEKENCAALRLGSDGLIMREMTPVFNSSDELVIAKDTFAADALIFEGLVSRGCTVRKADGRDVHVDFGGAPCVGMWAKPGADYVCIEPWYGLDDRCGSDWTFEDKKYVQKLTPGGEFVFRVRVTLK